MRPYKISHLSAAFSITVVTLSALLASYMWLEMDGITSAVKKREDTAARQELGEALKVLEQDVYRIADDIAEWDETKQQLVYDEYYQLWRDIRVRNSGKVPTTTDTVALYNKDGAILYSDETGFMPENLPGTVPKFIFATYEGHDHIFYYFPIHADPARNVLLGFGSLKFDLIGELARLQHYRYIEINTLRLRLEKGDTADLEQAAEYFRFELNQNQYLSLFYDVFKNSLIRLEIFVVIIMMIAAFLLHRIMVRPLYAMIAEIDALQNASDSLAERLLSTTPLPVLELENVRRSFNDYQSRLAELHENLERSNQNFFDQARRDALTGTFNRRAFEEDWDTMVEVAAFDGCALMLFDCDHFKAINDTYGHSVGDQVISAVAAALQGALRTNDRLYRLGGDEFATLLPHADVAEAEHIAERCQEHVMAHDFRQYGMSEAVTISTGIAFCENDTMNVSELIKRADLAMYTAKRPGGRKIVFYDPELDSIAALVANNSISAVYNAIRDPGLITMVYEPIMRLPMMEQTYTEALVRINYNGKLFKPDEIFPIVQTRRLDVEFDIAVINAIGRDLANHHPAVSNGVSINLSAPGVVNSKVIDALIALRTDFPDQKIVVEITETALITQMELATQNIGRMREAGCLMALDDFGSGYSSLRYLATMPVDIIKFDMSMIRLLEHEDPRQRNITQEIASLVDAAGYEIVAEGIETENMLEMVSQLGHFHYAQGHYFSQN